MQRAFTAKMAATGDPAYSAEKAGYAVPHVAGTKLMRSEDVADEVRRRARQRMMNEGPEICVSVLFEVALDRKQKGSTRVVAAKAIGQMSGLASPQALTEGDLADMPADQIRTLLAEAKRALDARMDRLKTIDHEPAAAPESAPIAQDAPNVFS